MVGVKFILPDGSRRDVSAPDGETVMATARANDIEGVVAECGGTLSCATCHVYVDAAWTERLPPATKDEKDLIEGVPCPKPNSRLACQIVLGPTLSGLIVTVPDSQV
jgi:2Fe-2S ferredoxin